MEPADDVAERSDEGPHAQHTLEIFRLMILSQKHITNKVKMIIIIEFYLHKLTVVRRNNR